MIFCCYYLATLLFFCSNTPVQHIFVPNFPEKSKKYDNFLQFFLSVYQ